MTVVQPGKFTKNCWIVHFKWVNFLICKLHLKVVKRERSHPSILSKGRDDPIFILKRWLLRRNGIIFLKVEGSNHYVLHLKLI